MSLNLVARRMWSTSRPGRFTPGQRIRLTIEAGAWSAAGRA